MSKTMRHIFHVGHKKIKVWGWDIQAKSNCFGYLSNEEDSNKTADEMKSDSEFYKMGW